MGWYHGWLHGFIDASGFGGYPWHIHFQRAVFALLTTCSLPRDMALTWLAFFRASAHRPTNEDQIILGSLLRPCKPVT
jgi:hypothetical protein